MLRAKVLLAIVFASIGIVAGPMADAHQPGGYYFRKWITDLSPNFRFTASYPGLAYRDRVINGAEQWNSENRPLQFKKVGTVDYADFDYLSCNITYQKDGIHWRNISSLGLTRWCPHPTNSNELWSYQIVIDSQLPSPYQWWTFLSIGLGDNHIDLLSVVAHEFGHAGGRIGGGPDSQGHWGESSELCPDTPKNNSYRHLMCPKIYPGWWQQFDPEEHDAHTFALAYP